jgi:cytoskeleton protein RodZ
MTDSQPDNAAPDDVTSNINAVPFSVGTALRDARVHHGLSMDEVSNRIKFAPRQIEALEADDFAHLPEIAFVRGFVRSYARLLQLDDVPLLAALPHAPEQSISLEAKALTEVPYPDIYTERKQNIIWLAAALVVAVILGLSAWLLGDKQKEQKAAEATVSGAQNATVETLALPETLPVSAVPDTEPVTTASSAEKTGAEKVAEEKVAAEKASAERAVAEKASAEKAKAEKVGAEKAAAKIAAERAIAEKVSAEIVNAEKVAAKIAIERAAAEKVAAEKKKAAEIKAAPQVVAQPTQPSAAPLAKPVVKPATAASGQPAIRMTFDADSWVEIRDKDGKILHSQLNHAGTEQSINGNPPFSLTVGYAKAAHLYYKGKAVDLESIANDEVAHLTLE